MGWAWNSYADELATAVLLGVPTCLGLAWTFHNWRRRNRTPADVRRDVLLDGLLIASLLPYLYVTLSQGYGNQRTLSLMPFGELSVSFASSQLALSDVTLLNVGGNAALLLVFGALLPIRSRRSRTLGRVAAIAALLSTAVEITQYALAVGRVSSTDDVLLNTAGAVAGALLTRNWWQPQSTDRPAPIRHSRRAGRTATREVVTVPVAGDTYVEVVGGRVFMPCESSPGKSSPWSVTCTS